MGISKTTSFNFIRYATCWEDASVLRKGLAVEPNDKVLSICSGGDNSFALLADNPSLVIAVDISPVQLYLAELKKIAIKKLSYDLVLAFFGYRASAIRSRIYNHIKSDLSSDCRSYWDQHMVAIEKGVIYQGKFEKYLAGFAHYVLPLIHDKPTINGLLEAKSADDQVKYFNTKWNNFLWKSFFKFFFNKHIMGYFGRDPEFLKQVDVNVADYIKSTADSHLMSCQAQNNLFLHFSLKGNFGDLLPEYLQYENFVKVKQNIDNIYFFNGYAQDAFNTYGSFDKVNFSNIFEYMDQATFSQTSASIISNVNPGGRLAYWNLMVDRHLDSLGHSNVCNLSSISTQLKKIDRGFFYKKFLIDQKN